MSAHAQVLEYRTLSVDAKCLLDDAVSKALKEGWELYGNPYMMTGSLGFCSCQAMTRPCFVEMQKVEDVGESAEA